jgi:hypothetical protein
MSKVNAKLVSLVGCAATFIAFAMAGCAGSKTEDGGNGGDSSVGGVGNEGGSTSSVGGSTGNVGGSTGNAGGKTSTSASSTTPLPEGVTCGPTTAPGNPLLTDFSTITEGAYNGTNFSWGDGTKTLTGGTFFYDGDGDDTVAVLTVTVADAKATITGTIPATKYAGFGFWFGPCTDARAYKGLSFKMSGDMGNSQLQIQMQSSRNYPIDTKNSKGECEGTWSDGCASNSKTFSNLALTTELQTIEIPWADFTGGLPIDPLEPAELLGFQWHFNCGEAACTPNVVIDDVTFY